MNWFDPYTFLLTLIGISGIFLAVALLSPPRRLSRTLLSITAGLSGVFVLLTVMELIVTDLEVMIALRNVQQISLITAPVFLLGYARELYQETPRKTIRLLSLLLIPSAIDISLIFTDHIHGWMRNGITTVEVWHYTEVAIDSTYLNAFFGTYPFVLSIITIFILLRNMLDVPKQYRRTHWLSALVIALPIVSILSLPFLPFEIPGPFALSYSSMALFLILMNKKRDFNVVWPVSRQQVLENLSEGIFLIDQKGKVIEINHAGYQLAKQIFNLPHEQSEMIQKSADSLFEEFTPLLQSLDQGIETSFEFSKNDYYINVSITPLGKKSNHLRLVVWKDVTYQKEIEHKLQELAEMDGLTRLTNRRAFISTFHEHRQEHKCFVLLDIDHFKLFNDSYGHVVGDKVLVFVSQLMKHHFPEDILTRLGGEEFGILSRKDCDTIVPQIEAFMTELKESTGLIDQDIRESVTVSVGIYESSPEDSFEKVYERADKAMYTAKLGGRDRIFYQTTS
ncbi:diguanylate cyclase [Halobacillus litoralis]|uniref:diguanylate cyclase n=1 Tax=Halobacillus litoralis TaxID=45668 RepID=UPI001CD535DB|nr:diguanylate cyclase [Halobacillus litoralis]MCA0969192.1 diguanylate cyclase [Halobacillus litoralis]